MKILVSTDSSCLISTETFKGYDISVFPLNVIIDGQEFLDGVTINQSELLTAMRADKDIKTSTPPLGEVIEYFEKIFAQGYDHVIHFTISSKLSSMNQLFNMVAEQNFPGKITVIDSLSVCSLMLSYVFTAYDDVQKGISPDKIAQHVKELQTKNYLVFIPENLTALKKGGRISPTVAVIGNLIGIKPVLLMKDGALEKEEMTRKMKNTLTDRLNTLKEQFPAEEFDYTLVDFDGAEHVVNYVYDYAQKLFEGHTILRGFIPINVCAHAGPGTIGIVVSPKVNGKSITNFINA